uniref:J domain-containing protein n=1 Tax=Caenorhabditis tropicalis TaxID=1561998 RepID=A0A1I7U4P1_9PELO
MPLKPGANPYKILDLQKGCTDKEIQKAYRAQCLKWHPDKNLDNKEEAERRFIEAKEAFDFLYDKEKRAAYDKGEEKIRVAQENYDKRMAKADGERRKLIEELERREKEFNGGAKRPGETVMTEAQKAKKKKTEQRNIKEEIEAIRRQLEKEVNEEIQQKSNLMKTEREKHQKNRENTSPQLLVKWKTSEGLDYSEDDIRELFSNYGKISTISSVIIKKDRRKRIIEYEPGTNAWGAELETGNSPMPELSTEWIKPPTDTVKKEEPVKPAPGSSHLEHMSLADLEAQMFS